jgi:hypothetical protein
MEEECLWLRMRSLTLRLLAALTALGRAHQQQNSLGSENGVGDKASVAARLFSQLEQALQSAACLSEKRSQVGSTATSGRGVLIWAAFDCLYLNVLVHSCFNWRRDIF